MTGRVSFKKEIYARYKSATVHTVKRRFPFKLVLLPILVAVVAGLAWFGYSTLRGSAETKKSQQAAAPVAGTIKPAAIGSTRAVSRLESIVPAIPDLPHTAARYEALTAAKAVPVVRGCFVNRAVIPSRCWCVSQRGTPIDVSREFCENVVNHGLPFYDFEPDAGGLVNVGHVPSQPPAMLPSSQTASNAAPGPKIPSPLQASR